MFLFRCYPYFGTEDHTTPDGVEVLRVWFGFIGFQIGVV